MFKDLKLAEKWTNLAETTKNVNFAKFMEFVFSSSESRNLFGGDGQTDKQTNIQTRILISIQSPQLLRLYKNKVLEIVHFFFFFIKLHNQVFFLGIATLFMQLPVFIGGFLSNDDYHNFPTPYFSSNISFTMTLPERQIPC